MSKNNTRHQEGSPSRMPERPLISIVTICRNAAGTIGRTAASVRAQDFDDYEHLIIDGASRDETLAIARTEGSDNMRILSEPDKGLYDAMNKGLRLARGEYIIFLNAGDKFHSHSTLRMMAEATGPETDIVYGDTVLVDDFGTVLGPRHHSAPERLDRESYKQGMLVCHQAFLVRRELAPEYDLQYRFSADYDWCLKCIEATEPERCVRLGVTTDYLVDGLTDHNRMASLRERFRIMADHYGTASTLIRHIGFVPRLIARKLRSK